MGFFDPINLLLGVSLVALAALYLRSRSRPVIEVSSLELFADTPAPVAKSRFLRLDALFWLEAGMLLALTLVSAGLYLRLERPVVRVARRALLFDLGAAMEAQTGAGPRLDAARREALELIRAASPNVEFSVIGYAHEARVLGSGSARRGSLQTALSSLRTEAVPVRPAALREALIEAGDVDQVDLFTDHAPSSQTLKASLAPVRVHWMGGAIPNLAIVSLDPGVPKRAEGRCLLRNFSAQPQSCELQIEAAKREVFHSTLIIEPNAEEMVRFGPLKEGGLVHAQILGADGLYADNDRYAYAPQVKAQRALVISPDNAARDDLARLLLAENPSYQVTAIDPAVTPAAQFPKQKFQIAVVHDAPDIGVNANVHLLIFPETPAGDWPGESELRPTRSVAMAELRGRESDTPLASPVLLGPARVIDFPGWMEPLGFGSSVGDPTSFPLAAAGRTPEGALGVLAFDVRNHLLLDPDRLQGLLLALDTIRRIAAPSSPLIVATGDAVEVASFGAASLTAPDGRARQLQVDHWGRVRFIPAEAGRYTLSTAGRPAIEIYANYYDETESNLAAAAPPASGEGGAPASAGSLRFEILPVRQGAFLAFLALLFLSAESVLLVRRTWRLGVDHV